MSLPPELAGYEVVAELGRGGMGVVYEVRAPNDPRRLALKLISSDGVDAEAILRFGREAELMAKVQHPNVLRIVNAGRLASGKPFLVTERIDGEDLDVRLRRGPLDAEASARLVRALCDAVAHLHEHGILHRDLKPANVMLRADGTPVLLDFGLARDPSAQTLTQSGQMLGTPGFMAPEQVDALAFADLDARVDVYGLGAILYYLLCGRAPIKASGGMVAMAYATLSKPADWSPAAAAPAALVAIGRKALAKAPEARYATAADMRDDLDRFLADEQVEAPSPTPTGSRRGVAIVVTLLILVGLGALALQKPRPPTSPDGAATDEALPNPDLTSLTPDSPYLLTTLVPKGEHNGDPGEVGCMLFGPNTVLYFCGHRRGLLSWRGEGKDWTALAVRELWFQPQAMSQVWSADAAPRFVIVGADPKTKFLALLGRRLEEARGELSLERRRQKDESWGEEIYDVHLLPGKNNAMLVHAQGFPDELPVLRIDWGQGRRGVIRWGGQLDWRSWGRPGDAYKPMQAPPQVIDLLAVDGPGAVLAASGKQLAYWPHRKAHAVQTRSHTFKLRRELSALAADSAIGVWGDKEGRVEWGEWHRKKGDPPVQNPSKKVLTETGRPVVALALDHAAFLYVVRDDRLEVFHLALPEPRIREVPLQRSYRSAHVMRGGKSDLLLLVRRDRCAIEVWDAKALQAPPK